MRCHSVAPANTGRQDDFLDDASTFAREAAIPLQPYRRACDICRKHNISTTRIVAVDIVSKST